MFFLEFRTGSKLLRHQEAGVRIRLRVISEFEKQQYSDLRTTSSLGEGQRVVPVIVQQTLGLLRVQTFLEYVRPSDHRGRG